MAFIRSRICPLCTTKVFIEVATCPNCAYEFQNKEEIVDEQIVRPQAFVGSGQESGAQSAGASAGRTGAPQQGASTQRPAASQPAAPASRPAAPQAAAPASGPAAPQAAAPAPRPAAPQPAAPAPRPAAPQPAAPAPRPATPQSAAPAPRPTPAPGDVRPVTPTGTTASGGGQSIFTGAAGFTSYRLLPPKDPAFISGNGTCQGLKRALKNLKVGGTIRVGHMSTGEWIEWIALDRTDNAMLLIAKQAIIDMAYCEAGEKVSWDTSKVRKWLQNFLFTNGFGDENHLFLPVVHTQGGQETEDCLFILTETEIEKYVSSGLSKNALYRSGEPADWWVNSGNNAGDMALAISKSGHRCNFDKNNQHVGIRPAVWVDIS